MAEEYKSKASTAKVTKFKIPVLKKDYGRRIVHFSTLIKSKKLLGSRENAFNWAKGGHFINVNRGEGRKRKGILTLTHLLTLANLKDF